jgi:hypothetical protein
MLSEKIVIIKPYIGISPLGIMWVVDLYGRPYPGYTPNPAHREGFKHWEDALARANEVAEDRLRRAINHEVRVLQRQLDGSARSAIRMLTGFSDEKLDELGGFGDTRG